MSRSMDQERGHFSDSRDLYDGGLIELRRLGNPSPDVSRPMVLICIGFRGDDTLL
jgi:hypothetical protein